eukprot:30361_1
MLSSLRRACISRSTNRLSLSLNYRASKWIFTTDETTNNDTKHHAPMSSTQEHHMKNILELWDYELERNNAGAFGMQYIVSHPTTHIQNTHILKATSLFQQIMGYIAGADGLSQGEIDLLCENQQLLCNYTFTSQVAKNNLELGASFTEQHLDASIRKYLKDCHAEDHKQYLVSGLYMCLCVSGSDGLRTKQITNYYQVADKMGFSRDESDKILSTYYLECE